MSILIEVIFHNQRRNVGKLFHNVEILRIFCRNTSAVEATSTDILRTGQAFHSRKKLRRIDKSYLIIFLAGFPFKSRQRVISEKIIGECHRLPPREKPRTLKSNLAV